MAAKKYVTMILLATTILFSGQIYVANALQKVYECSASTIGSSLLGRYQVTLTTSDTWVVDNSMNITIRMALAAKGAGLNYTEPVELRFYFYGPLFNYSEVPIEGASTLRNVGDFWESNVPFYVSAEYLGRGETYNASISFRLIFNEKDLVDGITKQYTVGALEVIDPQTHAIYDDRLYIPVFRPLVTAIEIAIIATVGISIIAIGGFIFYRRRRAFKQP
jgi:hypothetical protein